jgi:TolB-like protein/Tfp pilus assembly protein PilF
MRYRFDRFEIDLERYELRLGQDVCPIEPLVFDLLSYLVRNANRIVTRDDVVSAVWQGRAVSDATISSCIKSVRRVLGDNGDSQSLIRTVRGRGFEFCSEVFAIGGNTELAAAVALEPATATKEKDSSRTHSAGEDPKPIIIVLPLANLAADADAYFADGLTEDIITNLSRFRDLRVISGASSLQFRGREADITEVCQRTNAGYVVKGSVRRAAGRVRIAVELVDGSTGVQLWGDRYDREMVDIFYLQDEVTRIIAATLGVTMQEVALQRAMKKSPLELSAYDCLLRARRYTWLLSAEMHAEARDLLEKAVELDPLSPDAHALLSNVYLGEHRFDMNPRPNPMGRALTHALAATRLDPQNAYARCWLAIVHFFRFENDKFETEAQIALRLNPNDPETLADIGHYYAFMGEFERGTELTRRAQALNPLHPTWYYFSFARLHYSQRRYDETLADMQRIGLPHFAWSHLLTGAAKGQLGHPDAREAVARLYEIKPEFSALTELKKWNTAPDDLQHILDGLRKAGLKE